MTNTLAHFLTALVTKKKIKNIDTLGQCYKTFLAELYELV